MPVAHKSAISVGLLYIPVGLYKTTRDISISFNQLCKDSKERVRYKKYCPSCDKEVKNEDIIKGYEYEKDKYVTFTQDEIEKIKTKKDKTIHVEHFAKMSEIDSIFFDKNYYLVPEAGAEKAYELLRRSLLAKKEVAVAKTVIGTNEDLLVVYPTKECLIAKILYYQEEIQEMPKSQVKVEVSKQELEIARKPITKCYNCLEKCEPRSVPYCITKALIDAVRGDVENGLVFCGENVDRIQKMTTVHELMQELCYGIGS